MRDLLVITPTRGRPERALRLASSISRTATLKTDLCLAFDDDDETAPATVAAVQPYEVLCMAGPRQGLGPWTNQVAEAHFGDYKMFASFGDDHVPRTLGWDAECQREIEAMEGGIVAPNGLLSAGMPEQVVISASLVEALGWMCLPGLDHWYVDQVWYDLARATHRYRWLERVFVEHWQKPDDATGQEAWRSLDHDRIVYASWLMEGYPADCDKARKALGV